MQISEKKKASEVITEPTHLTEGVRNYACNCGDTYAKTIAKLTEHTYKTVVTAPTCTTQGYTTYSCECGDSYVSDYAGTKKHSYSSAITCPSTHLATGIRTYTCTACGDTYTESIEETKEHSHVVSNIVAPTCEKEGYTIYICECGDSYNGDTCTVCGESKVENCSCNCHKTGFAGFIWKLLRFFYKLFGMNKTCACGLDHY